MDAKFKSLLLEIMDDIDKVCRENNLQYFLIGGSMLGAVRHKGIIPWDDDIDVGMPREDYEKFKEIAPKCLNKKFEFIYHQIDKDYHYCFGKVYHKETTLVEFKEPFYLGGIFVDVFPLDGMPSCKIRRFFHFWRHNIWNKLSYIVTQPTDDESNYLKRLVKIILKRRLSLSTCLNKCNSIATKYSYNSSNYVANLGGAWGAREITRKDNFKDTICLSFEGRSFYIPIGYANILTEVYGNYMQLPPEEKRISHHSHFYINLENRVSRNEI